MTEVRLRIGRVGFRIRVHSRVGSILQERYQAFLIDDSEVDMLALDVSTAHEFSGEQYIDRLDRDLKLTLSGDRVLIDGTATGYFDLRNRSGQLRNAQHLGEVDALLRLALSLQVPRYGGLIFHGASVTCSRGMVLLVGKSGVGKSTASRALGPSLSDELTIAFASHGALEMSGTPYWDGRAEQRTAVEIIRLEKGAGAPRARLCSSNALRALAPHVVRYIACPTVDAQIFVNLGQIARVVPVSSVCCPEGAGFLPHLRGAMEEERAAVA